MTLGPGISRTLLPKGFLASGLNSGVRRYRPDVGLILSEVDAVAAGVFTLNTCAAAPVQFCRGLLPSKSIRGIFTNSGQANAATGHQGEKNNLLLAAKVAESLGCAQSQVLIASTGVIGQQIDMEKVLPSIPALVKSADDAAENFALAILTTDLVPKTASTQVELSTGTVRVTGISKGSGMIHPNMATMLGYLLTDAKLSTEQVQTWVREIADVSFNMISVDGDTSTNDSFFMMANGAANVAPETPKDIELLKKALTDVAQVLAQSIAADGEGASKLIEVRIKGSSDLAWARRAARSITVSPLIKSAVHGEDPNWGRILARLGAEGITAKDLARMTLHLEGNLLFAEGAPVPFEKDLVKATLKKHKIHIEIDLKGGDQEAVAWGCDLTKKYVEINTEYS